MNRSFSEPIVDKQVADFLRDGFCILPGFIDRTKIETWSKEFRPLLTRHIETQADASFRGANRHYVTLPFTQPFADPEIFDNDSLFAIMERIAGKDFVMCQLASDTPTLGSDYQDIHSDAPPLFPEETISTPSFQLAVNFPLCDVTKENGPLEITRGTHRIPKAEGLKKIENGEIPIESIAMKAGDVIIRDVRCLHRGTPNKTNTPRPMVVIGYSRKWLYRPEVKIDIPRAALSGLSDRARHMLRFNPIVESLSDAPPRETYKAFAY